MDFGNRFWIGVNSILGNGWQNLNDGSNTTFFEWEPNEPRNSNNENGCVSVDMSGNWYNDNCFHNFPFVCEISETNLSSVITSKTSKIVTTQLGPTTTSNCQYTSQDVMFSFFLDGTSYPNQTNIVIAFLIAISNTPNPGNVTRKANVYNIAANSIHISDKVDFNQLVAEYVNQGVQSMKVNTVSLNHVLSYYEQSTPFPNATTAVAPIIIMMTSSYITDLDQAKAIIDYLRQKRNAYIVSVTLTIQAAIQLSEVKFDLAINLTNATRESATNAATRVIDMICRANNNS